MCTIAHLVLLKTFESILSIWCTNQFLIVCLLHSALRSTIMFALIAAPLAFTPRALPAPISRAAVRTESLVMIDETNSRRDLFAKVGAAVLGAAFVDGASAKAGQFGKIGIFGFDVSSPYVEGGPKSGPEATFGFAKSNGDILAKDYSADVAREKASFEESSRRISSLQPKIDSSTWWFIRDELRIQAYNMRSSMLAMNNVSPNKAAAEKAYKAFWTKVEAFDLACQKKDQPLSNNNYAEVLKALETYTKTV